MNAIPEEKGDYLPDGWRIENHHTYVRLFDPNNECVIHQPIGAPWNYGDADYYRRSDISLRQIARWHKDRPEHQPIEGSPVALRNRIRELNARLEAMRPAVRAWLLELLRARLRAMLPPGVIVNPAWLAAGPGSEVEIHIHPGAVQ